MRRAGATHNPGVSLFPFLAVLICTMGVMMLLLVIINRPGAAAIDDSQPPADAVFGEGGNGSAAVLAAMNGGSASDQDEAKSAKKKSNYRLALDHQMLDWRISQLKMSRDKTLSDLRNERLRLATVEDGIRDLRSQWEKVRKAAGDIDQSALAKNHDVDEIEAAIARLKSALNSTHFQIGKAVDAARYQPPAYAIVPYDGASGTRRQPIYVECRSDAVVLQPEGIELTPKDFKGLNGPGNPLASTIRAARDYLAGGSAPVPGREPYPLLIVRSDGIEAFYMAKSELESWGASDFGYELVEADRKLVFQQPIPQLAQIERAALADARSRYAWFAKNGSGKDDDEGISGAANRGSRAGGSRRDGGASLADDPSGNGGDASSSGGFGFGGGSGTVGKSIYTSGSSGIGNALAGNGVAGSGVGGGVVGSGVGSNGNVGNPIVGNGSGGGTAATGVGPSGVGPSGTGSGGIGPGGNPNATGIGYSGLASGNGTGTGAPSVYANGGSGTGIGTGVGNGSGMIGNGASNAGGGIARSGFGGTGTGGTGFSGSGPGGSGPGGSGIGSGIPGSASAGGGAGYGNGGSSGLGGNGSTSGSLAGGPGGGQPFVPGSNYMGLPGGGNSSGAGNNGALAGSAGSGQAGINGANYPSGSANGAAGFGLNPNSSGGLAGGPVVGSAIGSGTISNGTVNNGTAGNPAFANGAAAGNANLAGMPTGPPSGTIYGAGNVNPSGMSGAGSANPSSGGSAGTSTPAQTGFSTSQGSAGPSGPSGGSPSDPNSTPSSGPAANLTLSPASSSGGNSDPSGESSGAPPSGLAMMMQKPQQQPKQSSDLYNTNSLPSRTQTDSDPHIGEYIPSAPEYTPDKPKPKNENVPQSHDSLAEKRGMNWSLPTIARLSTPVERTIHVECRGDCLVLKPGIGNPEPRVIPLGPRTADSVDKLVAAVWDYARGWGIAGEKMYWRPKLQLEIGLSGEGRIADLKALMKDSGLNVASKPLAMANTSAMPYR